MSYASSHGVEPFSIVHDVICICSWGGGALLQLSALVYCICIGIISYSFGVALLASCGVAASMISDIHYVCTMYVQACPFLFEVLTEDCEGEIEIVDLLPFHPIIEPALSQLVVEKGVEGVVKGGEAEMVTYTFTTPNLTTILVENKVCVRP